MMDFIIKKHISAVFALIYGLGITKSTFLNELKYAQHKYMIGQSRCITKSKIKVHLCSIMDWDSFLVIFGKPFTTNIRSNNI
jgi:hypothetical protein